MQSYGVNVPQDQQIRFRSKPRAPVPAGTKLEPSPNARALRPAEPGLLKDPNLRCARPSLSLSRLPCSAGARASLLRSAG